jgi:hypothetical protein
MVAAADVFSKSPVTSLFYSISATASNSSFNMLHEAAALHQTCPCFNRLLAMGTSNILMYS